MADPEITAALTPEEWECGGPNEAPGIVRDVHAGLLYWGVRITAQSSDEAEIQSPRDRHAVAALCLHGQPFGFTQADINLICRRFDISDDAWRSEDEELAASLVARVAALLPPASTEPNDQ